MSRLIPPSPPLNHAPAGAGPHGHLMGSPGHHGGLPGHPGDPPGQPVGPPRLSQGLPRHLPGPAAWLGTRLGLAILAATLLGLARLSKWPHRCTVCSTYCREKKRFDSCSTIPEIRS